MKASLAQLNEWNAKFQLGIRFGNASTYESVEDRRKKLWDVVLRKRAEMQEQADREGQLQERAEQALLFGEGTDNAADENPPPPALPPVDGNPPPTRTLTPPERWRSTVDADKEEVASPWYASLHKNEPINFPSRFHSNITPTFSTLNES